MPLTCLLISPYFPPMGVSGAKRALHLVRNLPAFGWRAVVLASRPVSESEDPTLLEAVPDDAVVSWNYSGLFRPGLARARGLLRRSRSERRAAKPGTLWGQDLQYLTPFDRFLVDTPHAVAEGLQLIRQHQVSVIHVSADPWSGLVVGLVLHRLTGLPLISDFRDPWSVHAGKMALRPSLSRQLLRNFEKLLFMHSAKVVLNTATSLAAYRKHYAGVIPPERFTCVRNAFDPGIFLPPSGPSRPARFTLLYFGRFRQAVRPDRLFEGFLQFVRTHQLTPEQAGVTCVGGFGEDDWQKARALGVDSFVQVRAAVPFRSSLQLLGTAHVLLLVVPRENRMQIPGKLYDYLCAGRPILALSDNPELDSILEETGSGLSVRHDEPGEVARALSVLYGEFLAGRERRPDGERVAAYSAVEQARRFSEILTEATRS